MSHIAFLGAPKAQFLVWLMRSVAETRLLIGWLAALYVTNAVRFFHTRHSLARKDTETKDLNWFTFGVLVFGIVSGSSAILFSFPGCTAPPGLSGVCAARHGRGVCWRIRSMAAGLLCFRRFLVGADHVP